MNFFEYQDQAHRNTMKLLALFGLTLLCMTIAIYAIVMWTFGFEQVYLESLKTGRPVAFWHWDIFFLVALGVSVIVGGASLWKIRSLRGGGMIVATSLGGRLVSPETTDLAELRLLNVVEEMAIAAGLPVPQVFLLEQEQGINAFAAGFTPSDAVIGVTRGSLDTLNRDELQGVIGHEFSHILNGDMRLNIRLIGILYGIVVIYIIGRVLLRWGDTGSSKARGSLVLVGLGLVIIGGIGIFFGRLIKSAVSRQREFLADASAVQFTRDPSGLSSALRKIAKHTEAAYLKTPNAEEASHLFFGNAVRSRLLSYDWFATHPPLSDRIRRINGSQVTVGANSSVTAPTMTTGLGLEGAVMGLAAGGEVKPDRSSAPPTSPAELVEKIGTVTPEQLAKTQALLAKLPDELRTSLRQPYPAIAIIYSLLLAEPDTPVYQAQLERLHQSEPADIYTAVVTLHPLVQGLNPRMRLPIVDLAIPAIRTLPQQQCVRFFQQVQALVRADGRLSLAEYVLQIVLQHRFQSHLAAQPNTTTHSSLQPLWADCVVVLSSLAQVGHPKPEDAAYALRSGLFCLPNAASYELPTTPKSYSLYDLGRSLKNLQQAAPKLKQAIVDACAQTVMIDQRVTAQEADLLRAIVIALNCPLPPFLDTAIA